MSENCSLIISNHISNSGGVTVKEDPSLHMEGIEFSPFHFFPSSVLFKSHLISGIVILIDLMIRFNAFCFLRSNSELHQWVQSWFGVLCGGFRCFNLLNCFMFSGANQAVSFFIFIMGCLIVFPCLNLDVPPPIRRNPLQTIWIQNKKRYSEGKFSPHVEDEVMVGGFTNCKALSKFLRPDSFLSGQGHIQVANKNIIWSWLGHYHFGSKGSWNGGMSASNQLLPSLDSCSPQHTGKHGLLSWLIWHSRSRDRSADSSLEHSYPPGRSQSLSNQWLLWLYFLATKGWSGPYSSILKSPPPVSDTTRNKLGWGRTKDLDKSNKEIHN